MDFLLITIVSILLADRVYSNKTLQRDPKFFGIGIVRFENSICTANDGLDGTCYTKYECTLNGGLALGSCASNIGTCCVFQMGCGGTTTYNNTYFINPGFPAALTGSTSCSYIIQKASPNVCQLRIDFLSLTLAQPNGNGSCIYDTLAVLGTATTVPTICGENSGQHIYVNFNGNDDIRIVIQTNSAIDCPRFWNIKVSQIDCSCPTRAPGGCLMYYTDISNTVTSFNYGTTVSGELNGDVVKRPGTRELANLNYGVCVAPAPGFCSIQWKQTSGDPYSFTVTGNTIGLSVDPGLPTEGLMGTACSTDFVVVPNPIGVNADRFCGNAFPTVKSSSRPFILTVVTNGDEINDIGNRGFSLSYTQIRCSRD